MGENSFKLKEFALGSVAACGACVFSNPLEVVKTRMQLQGELKSRGTYQRHYRNVFHAFYTIGKLDGVLALQKGLIPGLWYQIFMNGVRLGAYQTLINFGATKNSEGEIDMIRSIAAGSFAGCMGAVAGSPFYLVKTHLQSQAVEAIAVGHQHHHPGMSSALMTILGDSGIRGLYRGVSGAIARVSVGSGAQLSTFSKAREMVKSSGYFHEKSIAIPVLASMTSSVAVVCVMTPFDVISTRLYNQGVDTKGKGLFYSGFFDCLWKILKKEGPLGFYKGWSASWFRLAPHTVLNLTFWDLLRKTFSEK